MNSHKPLIVVLLTETTPDGVADAETSDVVIHGQEQMVVSSTNDTAAAQPSVKPVEQTVEQPVDQPVAQPTENNTVTPEPTEIPSTAEENNQETEGSDKSEDKPTPDASMNDSEMSGKTKEKSEKVSTNTGKPGSSTSTDQRTHLESTQNTDQRPGEIEFGNFPEEYKNILKECMKGWGSEVSDERMSIIENAVSLYGVEYSMGSRNTPSAENPKYLDCSSFVGQSYWRAGLYDKETAYWWTGKFASEFEQISASEAIPGDIAQISWNPGGMGSSEHVGIYVGSIDGTKYYIHCTSSRAVVVDDYPAFQYFGRSLKL